MNLVIINSTMKNWLVVINIGPKYVSEQKPRLKPLASNMTFCTQLRTHSLSPILPDFSVTASPNIFITNSLENTV